MQFLKLNNVNNIQFETKSLNILDNHKVRQPITQSILIIYSSVSHLNIWSDRYLKICFVNIVYQLWLSLLKTLLNVS